MHLPHLHKAAAFLLFLVFCCTSSALADDSEQLLIQQRLEQMNFEDQDKIGEEPLYATAYLLELYRKNQFRRLWIRQDTIQQLFGAIEAAADEGLTPDDYHLQSLRQLDEEDRQDGLSPAKRMEYDILLSDAMILLGQHKRYGKVDPAKVEERHNLEPVQDSSVPLDLYLVAIQSDTVRMALDQRSPAHQAYINLKQALRQYRDLAEQGAWPRVSAGPSLKPGTRDARVVQARQRLAASGEYTGEAKGDPDFFDEKLSAGVKAFQRRHHLEADGVIGKGTVAAMNVSAAERVRQIRVNLERTRWVIHDMPLSNIVVDIAGFILQYYHENKQIWSTKVVVGRPFHQTPVFRSALSYIVLNPTWTIPPKIAQEETVPSIIADEQYLHRQKIRVFDSKGSEISPSSISWSQYKGRRIPYTLRQDPGPQNSLGKIKFIFSNPYHVYLHDTPSKSLFDRTRRAYSHGCIRVQNPLHLARLILANDSENPVSESRIKQILDSGKTTTLILKESLPIFLIYLTTNVQDGMVFFKPDLYNRDPAVFAALEALPSPLERPTSIVAEAEKEAVPPAEGDGNTDTM